jgi:hypothetical protein
MRGHNESAGEHDCGGLQVCDIVDALAEAAQRWPGEVDPANVNAVGYSGGGGNVLSLATKFPDLLNVGASFFGISDYEQWHRSMGRPDCNRTMEKALGGTPDEVPERYAARSAVRAVSNNPRTRLHLFWDTEETACPPELNLAFIEASVAAGQDNVSAHVSGPDDPFRWTHGYRRDIPDLRHGDDLFVPEIAAGVRGVGLADAGELTVCGYVVTRRFAVWIGDGKAHCIRIRYRAGDAGEEVEPLDPVPPCGLRVEQGATLVAAFAGSTR